MDIEIYQATLIIGSTRKTLTKSVAKQFPVRTIDARIVASGMAKPAIAKIRGETIGQTGWLLLVKDPKAGLAWEPANVYASDYGKRMQAEGYHVDWLEDIPTIIL
jgi:hypothetical protein